MKTSITNVDSFWDEIGKTIFYQRFTECVIVSADCISDYANSYNEAVKRLNDSLQAQLKTGGLIYYNMSPSPRKIVKRKRPVILSLRIVGGLAVYTGLFSHTLNIHLFVYFK